MCGNFPNIKVVEGNAFSLVLPLKRRTFESCQPIDEDIDATQLTDVVVKFGGVEYTPSLGVDGVTIILPATLARGTYDIVLTAKYQGTDIRAAYESAISIVPWNSQSDAQQFVPGSPIVCDAAYVIGGALTDAELEALKEQYRQAIADAQQAQADAEAAKEHYDQLAEQLTGVAQEQTLTDGVTAIRDDISHIDIDTSTLAKEATLGTPLVGQPSTIFGAIAALAQGDDSKQTIVDAINAMGGSADTNMTWAQLAAQIELLNAIAPWCVFENGLPRPISIGYVIAQAELKNYIRELYDEYAVQVLGYSGATFFQSNSVIQKITYKNANTFGQHFCNNCSILRKVYIPKAISIGNNAFQNCANLNVIDVRSMPNWGGLTTQSTPNLVDIIIGAAFSSNVSIYYYNPTNCYLTTSSSLCFDTDQEEYGRTFNNNFEKWKWCIINHFAANLPDRTGMTPYTITQNAGSAYLSHFDQDMIDAFTNKNWTLA